MVVMMLQFIFSYICIGLSKGRTRISVIRITIVFLHMLTTLMHFLVGLYSALFWLGENFILTYID